jgi:short-subunit dehydrogenase
MNLQDARILLTGASGGIGRPLARLLAGRGARLVLVGRDRNALDTVAREVAAVGSRALPIVCDLAAHRGADELVRGTRAALGGIDVLINNAGTSSFQSFAREAPEQLARIVEVNLVAPMLLARAALPQLARGARIVNVGSMFGSIGFPYAAAYCGSKFGLRGFSEALRRELADRGIGVTYVAPRTTRTDINSAAMYRFAERTASAVDTPERVAEEIVAAIERDAAEHFIGEAEPFFARLNALLPRLVDRALRKQARIAREVLDDTRAAPPGAALPDR